MDSRRLLGIQMVGPSPLAIFHPTLIYNSVKDSQISIEKVKLGIVMAYSTSTESNILNQISKKIACIFFQIHFDGQHHEP